MRNRLPALSPIVPPVPDVLPVATTSLTTQLNFSFSRYLPIWPYFSLTSTQHLTHLLSLQKREVTGDLECSTSLHSAVQMGNSVMVADILAAKTVWVDEEDNKGKTALHYAMEQSCSDIAASLLKGGANVDCVDYEGVSPCHIACKEGMLDNFDLLFYRHADICAIDKSGKTPFDLACEYGQEKMLEKLIASCNPRETLIKSGETHTASALHLAAKNGHVHIVSRLLHYGWYIDRVTSMGSALHAAAGNGKAQVVRFLIYAGINTSLPNSAGNTAYEYAKKQATRNPITFKEIRFLLKVINPPSRICDICAASAKESRFQSDPVKTRAMCRVGTNYNTVSISSGGVARERRHCAANPQSSWISFVLRLCITSVLVPLPLRFTIAVGEVHLEKRCMTGGSKSFVHAKAIREHCGVKADELSFSVGDYIWVVERPGEGRWKGIVFGQKGNSRCGWFQANTVDIVDPPDRHVASPHIVMQWSRCSLCVWLTCHDEMHGLTQLLWQRNGEAPAGQMSLRIVLLTGLGSLHRTRHAVLRLASSSISRIPFFFPLLLAL
ncbi:unnamed protein product [Caenorhabditis auriculariae]|uniref:SH3 domain-containing protein n=1 Tax=Caenorhabditis auriculariae TaxID=2777116 RepID=A0A8S1H645_9PELO|nr:unnamed protein product [Caenorhabditis auriculariae]